MKRIFFQILLFCLSINLFSQSESPIIKGKLIIGGTLSLDKIHNKDSFYDEAGNFYSYDYKTFILTSDLELEYLLSKHWAIGLITEDKLSFRKDKGSTVKFIENDILIGPVIRYYIKSKLFLVSSAEIGLSNSEYSRKDLPKTKYHSWSLNTGLGYSIMLDDKVVIEPVIRYNYYCSKEIIPEDMITKMGDLGFSLGIHLLLDLKHNSKDNEN